MHLTVIHLGGEAGVTGSCHLVRVLGVNFLVDCGLSQGSDQNASIEQWPLKPSELDFIFLTHAHIDHIGLLPTVIRQGFDGEIICSEPTRALILPMLKDAMKFADLTELERERLIHKIDEVSWGFECGQVFDLKKGITFELGRAGHILGSCFIRFECPKGGPSLLFSGDLGSRGRPIVPDPDLPKPSDGVILESTYGNRLHDKPANRTARLAALLERCLADGGKVFIPAFALGRTQEILYELDRIFHDASLRDGLAYLPGESHPPVFVDSPLGLEITDLFGDLSAYWNQEARSLLLENDHPLDFKSLFGVAKFSEHQQLLDWQDSAIILAGSGMCSGGRIVDHLLAGIDQPRNDIVFVGYQATGTPGRAIVDLVGKEGKVLLNGEIRSVRAKVHVLNGYSAHADQQELIDWVSAMGQKPKWIKLVHGEPEAQKALAGKLRQSGYTVAQSVMMETFK